MSVAETITGLQVGQKAPDFSAQALMSDGSFKEVKLSDYKGKWVPARYSTHRAPAFGRRRRMGAGGGLEIAPDRGLRGGFP